MGQDFYEHNVDELVRLLHAMEADIGNLLCFVLPDWVPHPPARRLKKARERVRDIFLERLAQRDAAGEDTFRRLPDYVAFTMADKATAALSGYMPSHHTLLMFTAHTSTVAAISWPLISLLRHPETLRRVTAELRARPHEDSLLLQACIRESSRMYSGFQMLRLAKKQVAIPGTSTIVPKGAVVSISPYSTHRDATNFPDPETWRPERWIDGTAGGSLVSAKEGSFMPFGAGSHRCVGEKMAGIMVLRTLTELLRGFDVEWADGEGPRERDLEGLDFGKIGSPWLRGDVRVKVRAAEGT